MRAWLACVVASGCYLQPTVFEGGATVPTLEPPPPVVDAPVGCITKEPGIRRVRAAKWWLGDHRAAPGEIDRALAASPLTAARVAHDRRLQRLSLALSLAGAGIVIGSLVGLAAWVNADHAQSREPLVMLAPMFTGYGLLATSVPISVHGDAEHRRAIDDFNDAAARENRCPP